MFYILYGEDEFSAKEALAKIKDDCSDGESGDANITVWEGSRVTLDELITTCNTLSFFSSKRLVIVEGLLGQFETKIKTRRSHTQSPQLKTWESLAEITMPETTVLVLVDRKLKKTNPLLKKLVPVAEVREFIPLKGPELQNWIRSRVTVNRCQISTQALGLLADLIGSNLWILTNEIDKLCLFTGDRCIEVTDINLLVSDAKETNVFHLVDAIVQRRPEVAYRLLHQALDEGGAPTYLLHMITGEFRLLIQAKGLSAQRLPVRTVGSKIGEAKDWKVEKVLRYAREYSFARLEEVYCKLLTTDLSIKTGVLEGEVALDILITDLCRSQPKQHS